MFYVWLPRARLGGDALVFSTGYRRTRVRVTGMASNVVPVPAGADPVELLRRYEPGIRFTEGELLFPMDVDAYVEQAALWGPSRRGMGT